MANTQCGADMGAAINAARGTISALGSYMFIIGLLILDPEFCVACDAEMRPWLRNMPGELQLCVVFVHAAGGNDMVGNSAISGAPVRTWEPTEACPAVLANVLRRSRVERFWRRINHAFWGMRPRNPEMMAYPVTPNAAAVGVQMRKLPQNHRADAEGAEAFTRASVIVNILLIIAGRFFPFSFFKRGIIHVKQFNVVVLVDFCVCFPSGVYNSSVPMSLSGT